ncbi:DUF2267 domain-containing protein [Streptomyces sp. NPDC059740]|uniref:DUF2267 domain-containing protein n=1 Tax=Streptomyces sp. NPDC059740 TaxID=3346926 RepID=UPI00364727CF
MHHDEFIGHVQAQASLPDRGSAQTAVRATMETLGERLPPALASHVAAQLPSEIGTYLNRGDEVVTGITSDEQVPTSGEGFGLPVFVERVAVRGQVSEDTALRYAAATFNVLDAAVAPELTEKVTAVLPQDIRELLPERTAE